MLTSEQQGNLVVCAINWLGHRNTVEAMDGEGCCPHCCAACATLKELVDAGTITDVIRESSLDFRDHDWWDRDRDRLDPTWLTVIWYLRPCQQCATNE